MSINSNHHKHPLKKKSKQPAPIDRFVYLAVILGPLMTLPQIYTIWIEKSKGASFISWFAYLVIAFIWLFYGVKHKDQPIIIVQLLWIIMDACIVAGLAFIR